MMNCRDCYYVRGEEKLSAPASGNRDSLKNPDLMDGHISKEYFCEKIGGMPCLNGECHDAYQKRLENRRYSRKKRPSRRERDRKYRKHLQELAALSESGCFKNPMYGGALYMDETTHGSIKKPYYRRYWRGDHNNRFKYWLKASNRKVRRYKGDIHNGGFYRKIFDYWQRVD